MCITPPPKANRYDLTCDNGACSRTHPVLKHACVRGTQYMPACRDRLCFGRALTRPNPSLPSPSSLLHSPSLPQQYPAPSPRPPSPGQNIWAGGAAGVRPPRPPSLTGGQEPQRLSGQRARPLPQPPTHATKSAERGLSAASSMAPLAPEPPGLGFRL